MSSSEFKVTPLEGSINYRTWKFSMRMVLMAKDLWGVVDGSEVKSESGDAEWEKKNQKALAYISLSLTPIEQHHVLIALQQRRPGISSKSSTKGRDGIASSC